jgi:hypothetical protein
VKNNERGNMNAKKIEARERDYAKTKTQNFRQKKERKSASSKISYRGITKARSQV